jgi:hypothetical protein
MYANSGVVEEQFAARHVAQQALAAFGDAALDREAGTVDEIAASQRPVSCIAGLTRGAGHVPDLTQG